MGISSLWKVLTDAKLVRRWQGSDPAQHATLLSELDGKVLAVDLSAWIMQADQQLALLPHFSRTERCMKVALERSSQWLRHGVLPVIVVEGHAPEEKLAAMQARYAARNGGRTGGGRGSSSFQVLGKAVGVMLQQLGLPVFYAPGEAEATCAALAALGVVDACASFDSDTLVYGAEHVYHTVKLSTVKAADCEVVCCSMADIRAQLGIKRGGTAALSIVAMLSGSDYDLAGIAGVGSISGFKLVQHLLGPDAEDDSQVMAALEALVAAPPDPELAALTKCTGCKRCGHEGGRATRVAHHTARNPCVLCAAEEPCGDGGDRLHRPSTLGVYAELDRRRVRLPWGLATLRGKLLPLLLEWDLGHADKPGNLCEFRPVQVQRMQGRGGVAGGGAAAAKTTTQQQDSLVNLTTSHAAAAKWRYVVKWERVPGAAAETYPLTLAVVRRAGRAARGGPKGAAGEGAAADGGNDGTKGTPASEGPGAISMGPATQASDDGEDDDRGDATVGAVPELDAQASQVAAHPPADTVDMTVEAFDVEWLRNCSAEARAIRVSAVAAAAPELIRGFELRKAKSGPMTVTLSPKKRPIRTSSASESSTTSTRSTDIRRYVVQLSPDRPGQGQLSPARLEAKPNAADCQVVVLGTTPETKPRSPAIDLTQST